MDRSIIEGSLGWSASGWSSDGRFKLMFAVSIGGLAGVRWGMARVLLVLSLMFVAGLFGFAEEFDQDVALVGDGVVLSNGPESRVLVSPRLEGRVLVSTLDGESIGWVNREAVKSGRGGAGGADRFWFGPDGSQFTVFFEPGAPLVEGGWRVPPEVAEGEMEVLQVDNGRVVMEREIRVKNHIGTEFETRLRRSVAILPAPDKALTKQNRLPEGVRFVGFRVENHLTNIGKAWREGAGLLSLWSLASFAGGETVEVRLPIPNEDSEVREYFRPFQEGQIARHDGFVSFRCNGNWRSKIGLAAANSVGVMLSLDRKRRLLTVIRYKVGAGERFPHAERGPQRRPYAGDLANVYNHGSLDREAFPEPQFYEMESASPMPELKAGQEFDHWQEVLHFRGALADLEGIAGGYLAR